MRSGFLGDGLRQLADSLSEETDMVEIGCYAGSSTTIFMESEKVRSILAVDPFQDDLIGPEVSRHGHPMSEVKKVFIEEVLARYPQVSLDPTTSEQAARNAAAAGKTFDFVYIDGDHSYEGCSLDIRCWIPLIRPGGSIGGHDFCEAFPGVLRAVRENLKEPDRIFPDNSWIKKLL